MSLKQEYFELVKLLNKGNKQKNLITEVYFFINEDQTKFYMAIGEKQKILICERGSESKVWQESKVTSFNLFEESLAKYLTINNIEQGLTRQIKLFIFK